jgi:hypothetical protein
MPESLISLFRSMVSTILLFCPYTIIEFQLELLSIQGTREEVDFVSSRLVQPLRHIIIWPSLELHRTASFMRKRSS